MDMRFSEAEEAFRQEVRYFLDSELPADYQGTEEEFFTDRGLGIYKDFNRKLGDKGWLQLHWPEEYGGQGASPMQMGIFVEEMAYRRAPISPMAGWVGPIIITHGSEEQKKEYLPKLASGEMDLCLGYSEPEAGSDLFSLRTRADEDGDSYVINGQKIFTSLAHRADYCFLAVRTDPNRPKHAGISILMVDMKTPGITVRPLLNMGGTHSFNEMFFDNVRVPKDCLVGKKNGGLGLILTELDIERASGLGLDTAARSKSMLDELVVYANETMRNGRPLAEDPIIRQALAERATEIEVTRMLGYRVLWLLTKGIVAHTEASVSKVYGSEMQHRLANTGVQVIGLQSGLKSDSNWPPVASRLWDCCLLSFTWLIGGGTNEIQKNIIASGGLGLPSA